MFAQLFDQHGQKITCPRTLITLQQICLVLHAIPCLHSSRFACCQFAFAVCPFMSPCIHCLSDCGWQWRLCRSVLFYFVLFWHSHVSTQILSDFLVNLYLPSSIQDLPSISAAAAASSQLHPHPLSAHPKTRHMASGLSFSPLFS